MRCRQQTSSPVLSLAGAFAQPGGQHGRCAHRRSVVRWLLNLHRFGYCPLCAAPVTFTLGLLVRTMFATRHPQFHLLASRSARGVLASCGFTSAAFSRRLSWRAAAQFKAKKVGCWCALESARSVARAERRASRAWSNRDAGMRKAACLGSAPESAVRARAAATVHLPKRHVSRYAASMASATECFLKQFWPNPAVERTSRIRPREAAHLERWACRQMKRESQCAVSGSSVGLLGVVASRPRTAGRVVSFRRSCHPCFLSRPEWQAGSTQHRLAHCRPGCSE